MWSLRGITIHPEVSNFFTPQAVKWNTWKNTGDLTPFIFLINLDCRETIDEGTKPRHNCHWSWLLLWSPGKDKESIGPNLRLSVSNRLLQKKKRAIKIHYLLIKIVSFSLNLLLLKRDLPGSVLYVTDICDFLLSFRLLLRDFFFKHIRKVITWWAQTYRDFVS